MLELSIDPASPTPPYEQVRRGIVARIAAGDLLAGQRLPTVRELAAELGLAANTVARAYRELEQAGVVETRGRKGTMVAHGGDPVQRAAAQAADHLLAELAALGLPPEAAVPLVTEAVARAR